MDFCCYCWDPREKRKRGTLYAAAAAAVTVLNEEEETIFWVLIYFSWVFLWVSFKIFIKI